MASSPNGERPGGEVGRRRGIAREGLSGEESAVGRIYAVGRRTVPDDFANRPRSVVLFSIRLSGEGGPNRSPQLPATTDSANAGDLGEVGMGGVPIGFAALEADDPWFEGNLTCTSGNAGGGILGPPVTVARTRQSAGRKTAEIPWFFRAPISPRRQHCSSYVETNDEARGER